MRRALIIAAAAALVTSGLAACSREQAEPRDRVINTGADDAAMNAAIKQAQATLPVFWAAFEGKRPGTSDYAVKLMMTGDDGFKEHIWAFLSRREGDQVVAELTNIPEHLPAMKQGSEVRVSQSLITDWTYSKDGLVYGHYTTRVLWPHLSPEERAMVKLSPTPVEPSAS